MIISSQRCLRASQGIFSGPRDERDDVVGRDGNDDDDQDKEGDGGDHTVRGVDEARTSSRGTVVLLSQYRNCKLP